MNIQAILFLLYFYIINILLIIFSLISTYSVSAIGQEESEDGDFITINRTNNSLANLTAEAQISPYSSFVLLAYCPPASLNLVECETLIFPVLTEQPEIIG
jgi:hypothetical protein